MNILPSQYALRIKFNKRILAIAIFFLELKICHEHFYNHNLQKIIHHEILVSSKLIQENVGCQL
jgi:hypothetical protein